jgi:hypothetical protein
VGHLYQQTAIDTYSKVAFAKLYDRKTPLAAADLRTTARRLVLDRDIGLLQQGSGVSSPRADLRFSVTDFLLALN